MPSSKVRKLVAKLSHSGIHRVPVRFFPSLRQSLEEDGWKVFVLPDGIHDHDSFVRAATALFPHGNSWDALADSLSAGLYELPNRHIAIVWPDTTLRIPHPTTYEFAVGVLEQVSERLAHAGAAVGNPDPKDLAVVLGT